MHKLKEDFDARATEEMDRHLIKTDDWSLNEKLALSCRILARQDQGSALAGHVTARGPRDETCWTVRFGLGMDEVGPDDYLLVDNDLNVLEGDACRALRRAFTCGSTADDPTLWRLFTRTRRIRLRYR